VSVDVFDPRPAEGFEWVQPVSEDDFDRVYHLDGSSVSNGWNPLLVNRFAPDSQGGRAADVPWLDRDGLVLSERAYIAARNLLEPWGEFLQLQDADTGSLLWLHNVTRVVDALDESRSALERFSSGRVMRINTHAFVREKVEGLLMFRVPQSTSIFVTGDFVEAFGVLGLLGVNFNRIWSSADPGNIVRN
jgi:hypothetical protein